jgi:hypothetical protein
MTTYLPDTSLTKPLTTRNSDRWKPIVYGGALAGVGLLLLKVSPSVGEMPKASLSKGTSNSRRSKVARVARDGAEQLAPGNVTDKLGRSLLIGGLAMISARLLDELS